MKSPEARKGMSHIRSDEEEENGDGSDASIGKQRQIKLEQKEVKMGRRKKLMVEEEETQEDDEITEGEKDEKRKNRFRVESHISPDLRSFIQISSEFFNIFFICYLMSKYFLSLNKICFVFLSMNGNLKKKKRFSKKSTNSNFTGSWRKWRQFTSSCLLYFWFEKKKEFFFFFLVSFFPLFFF